MPQPLMETRLTHAMRAAAGRRRQPALLLRSLLLGLLLQPLQAQVPVQPPTKQEKKALAKQLEGARIKAKIDLPLLRGMVVYPNGELDARIYREKLSKFPVSIHRYETALLRQIAIKKNTIEVLLNVGGLPRANRNVLKWTDPYKAGSRIKIEFGRELTSQDMRPEVVVTALANVLEIDGFPAPAAQPARPPAAQPPATLALPEVSLQGIEIQPPKLDAGETILLIMRIEVKGMIGANRIEVAEDRQLFLDGRALFAAPRSQTEAWGNGIHTTKLEFRVPASAKAGIYTFRATVRSGAGSASRDAVFVVTNNGR